MEFSAASGATRDNKRAAKRALLVDVEARGEPEEREEEAGWDRCSELQDEDQEIELDEQQLFLGQQYYDHRAPPATVQSRSHSSLGGGPGAHYRQLIGEDEEDSEITSINMNDILVDNQTTEVISVDRLGSNGNSGSLQSVNGTRGPTPINHRNPRYEQFSFNQAPQSRSSIIASVILVSVIFFVTILPIMLPKSSADVADDALDANNPFNHQQSNRSHPEHGDFRCKCICPPLPQPATINSSSPVNLPPKRQYVGNTSPNQCNCDNVVLRQLSNVQTTLKDFCNSCECKYQSRNTMTIKRNVVFFIAILSGLSVFMIVQYLLKYFRITRRNLPRRLKWLSHQISETN